jgi:hypothetical protein
VCSLPLPLLWRYDHVSKVSCCVLWSRSLDILRRGSRPATTNATSTWVACQTVYSTCASHDHRVRSTPLSLVACRAIDINNPTDVRAAIMGLPDLDAFSEEMEITRWRFKSAWCRNDASKQSRVRVLCICRAYQINNTTYAGSLTTPYACLYHTCKRINPSTQLKLVVARRQKIENKTFQR